MLAVDSNFSAAEQRPFIERIDRILTAKANNPATDTREPEAEIDQLVYQIYNLTDEEIAIIEADY